MVKIFSILGVIAFLFAPSPVIATEAPQQWELVNPQSVVLSKPLRLADRPATLEGKTVVLRWNGKPNGDIFLNRIAELLEEKVKGVKVIKAWEVAPETNAVSSGPERSMAIAKTLVAFKPAIVIGAPAD